MVLELLLFEGLDQVRGVGAELSPLLFRVTLCGVPENTKKSFSIRQQIDISPRVKVSIQIGFIYQNFFKSGKKRSSVFLISTNFNLDRKVKGKMTIEAR